VPLQIVPGYNGNESGARDVAHEVVAQIGTANSLEQFVKNGNGYFALSISETTDLPGVPKASQYARTIAPRSWSPWYRRFRISALDRRAAGNPAGDACGVARSPGRLDEDPAFLAEAKKLDLPIAPAGGAEVDALIKQALDQHPDVIAI